MSSGTPMMKLRLASARQQLRQLPIQSFSETDNVGDVLQVLRELEMGQFRRAAILCDEMGRDDRIAAVLETRGAAQKATPLDVRPGNNKRIAKKLAEQLGGVDDAPGEWDRLFPQAVIGDLARWGNLVGLGVAEIIWSLTASKWTPRLKVWHPQFVRWDWSTDTYKILTATGEYDLPSIDENPVGEGKWLIWCPNGYNEAYKRGMIRSLAKLYVMRGWDYRDWARWNETKGMGVTKAIVPAESKDDEDEAFFEDVANRGSEPTILVRQGADGNKYDVEQVQDGGGGEGWKSFQAFKQAVDVDIAVLINGQNLTTESPAGGSSSKSLGEVQKQVSLDRLRADCGIAVPLRDQVLIPMVRFNVAPTAAMQAKGVDTGELAPRPVYMTEPPKDQVAEATAYKMAGDALRALQLARAPIDARAILEQWGIPTFTVEELAAQAAVQAEESAPIAQGIDLTPSAQGTIITVNEARRTIGLGPLQTESGAPDPDGLISITDYQVKHASAIADAANAEAGGEASPAPIVAPGAPGAPTVPGQQQGPKATPPAPPKDKAKQAALSMLRGTVAALASVALTNKMIHARRTVAGLPVAIENPAGSIRLWREGAKVIGATKMTHDYGYIEGVQGSDGEELDVYVGPNPDPKEVYVVHQLKAPAFKAHDEDKVMLGFSGADEARAAYVAHRNDGDRAIQGMSVLPLDAFKRRLEKRTGAGKIRASARPDAVAAITALVARSQRPPTALKSKVARDAYTDRLTKAAVSLGGRALAVDLAGLESVIKNASSLNDARDQVVRYYRHEMDPERFARVVQKLRLMSRLAGGASVHKEVRP